MSPFRPSMQVGVSRWRGQTVARATPPPATPRIAIRETLIVLATVVQGAFAVVVGIYTVKADTIARAQVEPAFEAGVSLSNDLVVENAGRDPILDVIVSRRIETITDGKRIGIQGGTIPAAPGEKREWVWQVARLNAGEIQRKSLNPVLEEGLHAVTQVRFFASKGGLTGVSRTDPFVFSVVALKITYRREADGRRFTYKTIRFVPSQAENTGTVVAELTSGPFWRNFKDVIESVNPEL